VDVDLDTAREAFEGSTDFTVGLEEEFALLDASDLGLTAPMLKALSDAGYQRPTPIQAPQRRPIASRRAPRVSA